MPNLLEGIEFKNFQPATPVEIDRYANIDLAGSPCSQILAHVFCQSISGRSRFRREGSTLYWSGDSRYRITGNEHAEDAKVVEMLAISDPTQVNAAMLLRVVSTLDQRITKADLNVYDLVNACGVTEQTFQINAPYYLSALLIKATDDGRDSRELTFETPSNGAVCVETVPHFNHKGQSVKFSGWLLQTVFPNLQQEAIRLASISAPVEVPQYDLSPKTIPTR